MKRKLIIGSIVIVVVYVIYFIFTTQYGSKHLGGTYTINLETNKKLVNVTWKDTDLWSLTRKAKPNDTADTFEFKEDSKFNVLSGSVIIKEKIGIK